MQQYEHMVMMQGDQDTLGSAEWITALWHHQPLLAEKQSALGGAMP